MTVKLFVCNFLLGSDVLSPVSIIVTFAFDLFEICGHPHFHLGIGLIRSQTIRLTIFTSFNYTQNLPQCLHTQYRTQVGKQNVCAVQMCLSIFPVFERG